MMGILSWRRTRTTFCARSRRRPRRWLAAGEEWFYLHDAGPSRWLKVVVVFDRPASGRIITAFPRRRKP